jgi:uncharacterized protein (TIGR00299 family) protein
MKVLYIDCFSGIAGDMMLGALLDLGLPRQLLDESLATLGLDGWHLHVSRAKRHGIVGTDVQVHGHDHHHHSPDTQGEHAESDHGSTDHVHGDHTHGDHTHGDAEGHEHAHGRTWREIRTLIETSGLTVGARTLASAMFERLAVAEGKLHDMPPEDVHFHEVGALDAIVDICGAAIGLDWLGADIIVCDPLPVPRGFVKCAHGRMPLPAPATLELMRGAAILEVDETGELVTPTGATIATTNATRYGSMPSMVVERIGYGVGDRDPAHRPNLLRLVVGEVAGEMGEDRLLETNIDDMTPELLGHVTDRLFAAGAVDVWLTPIQMKKGRPGHCLSVLCSAARQAAVVGALVSESTTIGVREIPLSRHKLERRLVTLDTRFGPVTVKLAYDGSTLVNAAPEYEDCRRVALAHPAPLKDVLRATQAAIESEVTQGAVFSRTNSGD